MAAPNGSFNDLISLTLRNTREVIADNLSTHSVVLASIKKAGGFEEREGGYEIAEPLMYAANDTIKPYSGAEPFDLTPQDPVTTATYDWKQIGGSTQITGIEAFKNSGKSQIMSLLKARMKQLQISFYENLDEYLVGDGTGSDGKVPGGLALYVEEGGATSVVGGIDSSTYSWWQNQSLDFDATYTGGFTATDTGQADANGLNAFRSMVYDCTRKKERPNLILTTSTVAQGFEALVEDKYRTQSLALAELGFRGLEWHGIDIVWDTNVPAGTAWFLNTNYLRFVVGKGHNFKMSDFEAPIDQDARVAKVHLYGNLTMNRRDAQGIVYDIT